MSQEISEVFNADFDEEVFELDFSLVNNRRDNNEEVVETIDLVEDDATLRSNQDVWIEDTCVTPDNWLPEFARICGPKVDFSDRPIDVFTKFFDNEFLQTIVGFTNTNSKNDQNWTDLSLTELKTFIGIQILMGVKRLDEERDHWSDDRFLQSALIKRSMARNRYMTIKQMLHFCNEESSDKSDPIYKVQYLLNQIRNRSQQLYQPAKQLSIDESLIGFKGRFKHLQYISSKSCKFGIKFFVLAESKTGYMYNLICFCGKSAESGSQTERIVKKLLEPIEEQSGHEVYCDNYYTSVSLAQSLSQIGIGLTGTVRQNRKGLPLAFKKGQLKLNKNNKGPIFKRNDKLLAIAWFDHKLVIGLSTHVGSDSLSVKRRSKSSETGFVETNVPKLIHKYNQFMGGVDLYDQRLKNHAYSHRCFKWPHVVWHLFRQIGLINGYVVYRSRYPNTKLESKHFKLEIAYSLLESCEIPRNPTDCSKAIIVPIVSNLKSKRKDCSVCSKPYARKQVSHQCSVCGQPMCWSSKTRRETCFHKHITSL